MRTLLTTAVMLAAALANGCASSPQASFYTLSAENPQQAADSAAPPALSPTWAIVMGAVTVPEIDDRPQFVRRVAPNQITLDEFSRWAEPLKSQVRRIIAADLAVQNQYPNPRPLERGAIREPQALWPQVEFYDKQWEIIRDPSGASLIGFLERWKREGKLGQEFVTEAKKVISDQLDTVIDLESGKPKGSS